MLKEAILSFKRLSIFKKILFSFVIITIIPSLLSLIISVKTTEKLVISQTYKDSLSSVDSISASVSNLFNQLILASLYISNEESSIDLITLLNSTDENMNGQSFAQWMELLRKSENVNNTVLFTSRVNYYVTLVSGNGRIGYTNYPINENTKKYLERYNPEYIKSLGLTLKYVGIEKDTMSQYTIKSPYLITWVKSISSKNGTSPAGCLVLSIPVDEISKLMTTESSPSQRLLLDSSKNIIASTEKEWITRPFSTIYKEDILSGNGYITTKDSNGVESILTYEDINREGMTIVDIKPLSDLTSNLRSVSRRILYLNLSFVLVFLVVSAIIARGITVPLRKLSNTMQRTDLSVNNKLTDKMNKDEVYLLEYNFDKMRRDIQTLLQENIDKEKKKREAELKALQSQISPHFLFNTLNTVRCAIEIDKKEKASEIIIALIGLLKMTIVKGDSFIPLKQEIENLENYIKIVQMRHGITFTTYFDIPEIIEDYKVPKLLLQPVVENSIIHGFEGLNHEGFISVTAELTQRM